MKNVFIPLLMGILIGVIPMYLIFGISKSQNCFICITESQVLEVYNKLSKEELAEKTFDNIKLLHYNRVGENIDNEIALINTQVISDELAKSIRQECDETKGVSFNFLTILKGVMESQNLSTLSLADLDTDVLSNVGFITVFAKYPESIPSGWPEDIDYSQYKNKRTAFIRLIQRAQGNTLEDIERRPNPSDPNMTDLYYNYNIGTLCPFECPPSLTEP